MLVVDMMSATFRVSTSLPCPKVACLPSDITVAFESTSSPCYETLTFPSSLPAHHYQRTSTFLSMSCRVGDEPNDVYFTYMPSLEPILSECSHSTIQVKSTQVWWNALVCAGNKEKTTRKETKRENKARTALQQGKTGERIRNEQEQH